MRWGWGGRRTETPATWGQCVWNVPSVGRQRRILGPGCVTPGISQPRGRSHVLGSSGGDSRVCTQISCGCARATLAGRVQCQETAPEMDTDSHVDACPGLKGHFAVCAARGLNLMAKVCCINGPAGAASSGTRASQPPRPSPGRRLRRGVGGHGQLLCLGLPVISTLTTTLLGPGGATQATRGDFFPGHASERARVDSPRGSARRR